jgi:hypothetical protein
MLEQSLYCLSYRFTPIRSHILFFRQSYNDFDELKSHQTFIPHIYEIAFSRQDITR